MHTRTSLFALLTLSTLVACGDDTSAETTGTGGEGGGTATATSTTTTSTGGDGGGGAATTTTSSSSTSTASQGGSGPGGGDQGGGDQGGGDQGGGHQGGGGAGAGGEEPGCPGGLTACGDTCVDTAVDPGNCGGCGEVCDPGEICNGAGVCALTCQLGAVACDGACVDPLSDREHCGAGADCAAAPGDVCDAGEICDAGTCTLSCQAGLVACDGVCIDPASNPAHCGAGVDCAADPGDACGAEEACFEGECVPVLLACDVDPAAWQLPVVLHPNNYYGEIAFDGDCNVLVVTSFEDDGVLRIDAGTGAVSTVSSGLGVYSMNGVAFREQDGLVYVATDSPNRLWRIVGGAPQAVADVSQMNAIAIAPAGFGAFEGDVVGVGTDGTVIAVDPATGVGTVIGTQSGILSDLVFAPDGSALFVASQDGVVRRMTAAGVFTDVATGLQEPDGLAIDLTGTRLYVAHYPAGGRIDAIAVADGAVTPGPSVDLDGGYYTTGLLVDRSGDIVIKTSVDGSAVLDVLPPF